MSHFTVAVIGDDHEAQLEPFYEGIEVEPYPEALNIEPQDARHVRDPFTRDGKRPGWDVVFACQRYLASKWAIEYEEARDKIAEDLDAALEVLPINPFNITEQDYQTFIDMLDEAQEDDEYREEYVVDDELGPSRMSTYNPRSKWDWYVIGGRWRGFYRVRDDIPEQTVVGEAGVFGNDPAGEGKRADQLMVGSIDLEGMRQDAANEANTHYDKWQEVLDNCTLEEIEQTKPWSYFREKYNQEDGYTIEQARIDYREQAVLKTAQALYNERYDRDPAYSVLRPFMGCVVENFGVEREEYVKRAMLQTAVPYAILHDGEWYEKGKMGWFGISDDEMSSDDWAEFVHKTYDNLKPTTQITLVDAHI